MNDSRNLPDYEWHIKLSDDTGQAIHSDALMEMIRRQLQALLGCISLTQDGKEVRVNGFRLLAEPQTDYAVYPPSLPPHTENARARHGRASS